MTGILFMSLVQNYFGVHFDDESQKSGDCNSGTQGLVALRLSFSCLAASVKTVKSAKSVKRGFWQ